MHQLEGVDTSDKKKAEKAVDGIVTDPDWNRIFKQNLNGSGWDFNIKGLAKNMKKTRPDVSDWKESYGLWPGRTFALFAAYSRWIHLSTNTLPFYNVFPRL